LLNQYLSSSNIFQYFSLSLAKQIEQFLCNGTQKLESYQCSFSVRSKGATPKKKHREKMSNSFASKQNNLIALDLSLVPASYLLSFSFLSILSDLKSPMSL
jgi:hypothetical protein